ncbi:hypothetical protein Acsp02_48650 [Actinoplanes sp. NBRC 103695]|nr:hypothetical protein Acsp02_48650 [Actinoplanes sp. NBRC 103695]
MLAKMTRALRPQRGGRLPLALLALVVAGGVTAAVTDASASTGGLRFAQAGHWFAQSNGKGEGSVFRVNGSTGAVDGEVKLYAMDEAGTQVVQGETSGYVIGKKDGARFGKSTLTVDETFPLPSGERAVPLEVKGGPYLVYREQGRVVRMGGEDPVSIAVGAALGDPVATSDGTLWLLRKDTNGLCYLRPGTEVVNCRANAPAGHLGALTVVGRQAVFVDTDSDTFTSVGEGGLGRPVRIGRDLTAEARVGAADLAGRVAVVEPGANNRLHLLDASGLSAGRLSAAPPIPLPAGDYAAPAAGRDAVVLLDRSNNKVLTFDRDGRQRGTHQVPKEGNQDTELTRGQDQRVYVAGGAGKRVLVIGENGRADAVPLIGKIDKNDGPPVRPPAETTNQPTGGTSTGSPRPASDPPSRGSGGTNAVPRTEERTRTQTPSGTSGDVRPPANPPSPPGRPPGLRATASGSTITVSWKAATANGATVGGYRVTWSGGSSGSRTVGGGSRQTKLTGLTRGKTYRITVAAQNSAGRGTAASTSIRLPAPAATRSVTVSRGGPAEHGDDCVAPDCRFIKVVVRGFPPNTDVDIDVFSEDWGDFNPGAHRNTDDKGNLTVDDRFPYNGTGGAVWVTANGLESNHVSW